MKKLLRYEFECARANDKRLASERQLAERDSLINELRSDKQLLGARCAALDREVARLSEEVERFTVTTPVVQPDVGGIEAPESSESSDNESTSDTNEITSCPQSQHGRRHLDPHPPGFRELCTCFEKFSGRTGDNDFKV